MLESSEFQLEVLRQGITHFAALGAIQRTTLFVRLQQRLAVMDKSKTCHGMDGGHGGKGWNPVCKNRFLELALSPLQKGKFTFPLYIA